jgi:hypothetical protein
MAIRPLWTGHTTPRVGYGGRQPDGEIVLDGVPPGTEVEVWPAGSRPVLVTREQVYEAIADAITQSGGSHVLGSDIARARNAVMALLSGQSPSGEVDGG